MLTLFRDLRRLRRDIDLLAAPGRGRSLALRHVDAGSCNGCEHELTLTTSPYYDLERFGLGIVASPRHADVLLVTGAVTTRMREPLLIAYRAMPEPRRVAAVGDCALGCNLLGEAALFRGASRKPAAGGCPHPRLSPGAGRDRRGAPRPRRPRLAASQRRKPRRFAGAFSREDGSRRFDQFEFELIERKRKEKMRPITPRMTVPAIHKSFPVTIVAAKKADPRMNGTTRKATHRRSSRMAVL